MELKIRAVSNGYIMEYPNDNDESGGTVQYVIEDLGASDPNPDAKQLVGMRTLLYSVMEHMGYFGSKHHRYRLRVIIEDQQADRESALKNPDDPSSWNWILETDA